MAAAGPATGVAGQPTAGEADMRDWTTGSMMALVSMGCVLAGAPALAQTLETADTKVVDLIPRSTISQRVSPVFQEGQKLAPMARATIFVRDLDESLKLYRDILGLKPMFDSRWSGKGINRIQNTEDKVLRACVLMAGESVYGNIGIYQLSNEKEAPPPLPMHKDTRTGDFAVVFPTNDIWALTKKIQDAGYLIISPPVTLIPRPGYKVQPVEMMFRDRDGMLVNLLQAGVRE
jgi:catechol 2,3-dioxygenase-like lactoylglutathione lyase family enzyme